MPGGLRLSFAVHLVISEAITSWKIQIYLYSFGSECTTVIRLPNSLSSVMFGLEVDGYQQARLTES